MSGESRQPPGSITTIRPSLRPSTAEREAKPVLTLTVLAHPQPEMVGARAVLRDTQNVSRLEPIFRTLGQTPDDVLADPNVSRSPVVISSTGDSLRVDPTGTSTIIEVNGDRLDAPLDVHDFDRPLVIELGQRIALLLHWRLATGTNTNTADLGLVGCSAAIEALRGQIHRIADTAVPALVLGETGSGKERVARALHDASSRASGPFVAVNMSTLLPAMAGSQLFGHAKGAFSGADRAHEGFFKQADGGTLFLDELGDTPAEVQPMLLRVLDDSIVRPIGSGVTQSVDVRVVAATDADLAADVDAGEFRAPLLHRLAGFRVSVPPLRDRPSDVGVLLYHFLAEELATMGEPDRRIPRTAQEPMWVSTAVVRALVHYAWPGNVRELRNVVRQLAVLGRDQKTIELDEEMRRRLGLAPASMRAKVAAPRPGSIADADLIAALEAHAFQPGKTAKQLGISRGTLYQMMERCPELRGAKQISSDEVASAISDAQGDTKAAAIALRVSERALKLRMKDLKLS